MGLPIMDRLRDLRQTDLNNLVKVSGESSTNAIIDAVSIDSASFMYNVFMDPLIVLTTVGVITRRTGVFPVITSIVYDCSQCGQSVGPFRDSFSAVGGGIYPFKHFGYCLTTSTDFVGNGLHNHRPAMCPNCSCSGLNFKINTMKTEYGNYQKITLQESPGSVPAGRVPRYKDVILTGT